MAEGIPDEAVRAFVEAYDNGGCCNDSTADFCCARVALEAAAPLIVGRALQDAATTITIHARRYDDATATEDERNVAHGLRVAAHLLQDPTAARIARGPGPHTAGTTERLAEVSLFSQGHPTGRCPTCQQVVTVNREDRFTHHTSDGVTYCPGSGEEVPVSESADG